MYPLVQNGILNLSCQLFCFFVSPIAWIVHNDAGPFRTEVVLQISLMFHLGLSKSATKYQVLFVICNHKSNSQNPLNINQIRFSEEWKSNYPICFSAYYIILGYSILKKYTLNLWKISEKRNTQIVLRGCVSMKVNWKRHRVWLPVMHCLENCIWNLHPSCTEGWRILTRMAHYFPPYSHLL